MNRGTWHVRTWFFPTSHPDGQRMDQSEPIDTVNGTRNGETNDDKTKRNDVVYSAAKLEQRVKKSRNNETRETRGFDLELVVDCTGRFSPLPTRRGGDESVQGEGITGWREGGKGKSEKQEGVGDSKREEGWWEDEDGKGEEDGYIGGSIHSAENHRGTFRGAPMREETREKERDEGKKARELVASMKLKQKTWGNTSCRSGTDRYTRRHSSRLFSFPLTFAFILSPLFFSATGLTEPYTSLRPSMHANLFFFPLGGVIFFFLSFCRLLRVGVHVQRWKLRDDSR